VEREGGVSKSREMVMLTGRQRRDQEGEGRRKGRSRRKGRKEAAEEGRNRKMGINRSRAEEYSH